MNIDSILKRNESKNKNKRKPYNPVSGLNCVGERFAISVLEKQPIDFHFPIEMKTHTAIKLLIKYGSIEKILIKELDIPKPTQYDIDLFWLNVCEERYKYDFEFFAIVCQNIRDKETGQLIPFELNRAQRIILRELERQRKSGGQININLLKSRQMGGSTLIQMYMSWIQSILKTNWNSLVCAHDLTAATSIRSMYDEAIENMTPVGGVKLTIRPFAGLKNIKEVPERGCRITVGTAERPETVRSQDLKIVHFSETAFYPHTESNNPELLEASIISTVPKVPNTMIIRESTANGVGDYFYNQYQKGKTGESTYTSLFMAWYIIPLYEIEFDKGFYNHNGNLVKGGTVKDFIKTLNEYEYNLFANHDECTLENLNWRRVMNASMPNESKMKQEYPSDDIEAFQDSGSPVFKSEDIEAMRAECMMPEQIGELVSDCPPELSITEPRRQGEILKNIRFVSDNKAYQLYIGGDSKQREANGQSKLHVWQHPDKSESISNRYIVVFDPQRGKTDNADWGVIKVIDRYWMMHGETPEVVAIWYGRIDKDITIWIAAQIAKYYNDALLVVESNTYDNTETKDDDTEFIFEQIKRQYDNLYSRTPADKINEGAPIKFGFHTNRNTKPAVISTYNAIIREQGYTERDEETLNEARVFENKKDGTVGAKAGHHDDRLMATMIGLYICYQIPLPRKIVKHTAITSSVKRTVW